MANDVAAILKDVEGLKARAEQADKKVVELESAKVAAEKELEELKTKALNIPHAGNSYDSDEAKTLRAFGVSNVKELMDVNTAAREFEHVPEHYKYLARDLKKTVDIARMTAQIFRREALDVRGNDSKNDRVAAVKSVTETYFGKNVLAPKLKAFGTTVSGYGAEYIPTLIASTYIPEFELSFDLQSQFREIRMPSSPYEMPVVKGVLKAQKVAEGAGAVAREFQTDKIALQAKKLESYFEIPEEMNEDSAPDFLSIAREELLLSHSRAVESALINGDDDGTHLDSDTQAGSALLAEKLWKGLRRQALANSAGGGTKNFGAALSTAGLIAMRAQMKKFGVDPSNLLWVVGPAVYAQILGLPEIITLDKAGAAAATILRGSASAILGIPIVVSQHCREDLNASGVYDGTTTTKGGILLVNRARWYLGMRRAPQIRVVQDLPNYDRYLLAAYQRLDFAGHAQSASEASVCYGYNITL